MPRLGRRRRRTTSEIAALKLAISKLVQRGRSPEQACTELNVPAEHVKGWRRNDDAWNQALDEAEILRILIHDRLFRVGKSKPLRLCCSHGLREVWTSGSRRRSDLRAPRASAAAVYGTPASAQRRTVSPAGTRPEGYSRAPSGGRMPATGSQREGIPWPYGVGTLRRFGIRNR